MSPGGVHVVSFGECMLELQGEAFGTMRQTYGGDTLNTAVYLARCGARAACGCQLRHRARRRRLQRRPAAALGGRGPGLGWCGGIAGRLPGLYLIEVDAGRRAPLQLLARPGRGARLLRRPRRHAAGAAGRRDRRAVLQRHQPGHPAAGRARAAVGRGGAAARAWCRGGLRQQLPAAAVARQGGGARRLRASPGAGRSVALLTLDDEVALHGRDRCGGAARAVAGRCRARGGGQARRAVDPGARGRRGAGTGGAGAAGAARCRHHRGGRLVCRRLPRRCAWPVPTPPPRRRPATGWPAAWCSTAAR
jgi:hypothetical protein